MNADITTTPAYKAAEVYEQFLVRGLFRYWTPLILERAKPQAGEQVLDVACGTGVVARSIVPLVRPAGRVVGLDINPAMLEVACRQFSDNCEEIEWREGQAEAMPFEDGEFDLVTCQQGFQFFNDKTRASQEMYRVLRRGGRAVLAVWQSLEANGVYRPLFEAIAEEGRVPLADIAVPFSFGDPVVLKQMLTDAGFRDVKVEPARQDVHFEQPERYVELTLLAASAVMPEFAQLDRGSHSDMQARITERIQDYIQEHLHDGVLTFPMKANMASGVR